MDSKTGEPVIFDPSSFFGHNEAECVPAKCFTNLLQHILHILCSLAIARIFGGFPDSFFSTYHKFIPKTEPIDQYELRVDLYELFHYLNHALIFGSVSDYISPLRSVLIPLLAERLCK